jgi:hypothetical protein
MGHYGHGPGAKAKRLLKDKVLFPSLEILKTLFSISIVKTYNSIIDS